MCIRQKIFPERVGLGYYDQEANASSELGKLLADLLAHEQAYNHDAR